MDPLAKPSFLSKYKLTLISLGIIILAAIPLLLLSNTASKKTAPHPLPTVALSPTPVPLTVSNADAVLKKEDANLQETLTTVDADLQAVASVNSSRDSTTGL